MQINVTTHLFAEVERIGMGFIKKIFGLISSIFKAIAGVFGLGKKGEFYMELDGTDQPAAPAAAESSPAPQASAATSAPASNEPPSSEPQMTEVPEPRVVSQASNSTNPVVSKPVVEAPQPTAPAVTNFATDYLVNPRTNNIPRRRPGPSVSPFKEMVKEMGKKSPSMG